MASSPDLRSLKGSPETFVKFYYDLLHDEPERLFPFYKDTSVLYCQDSNGVMTTATTIRSDLQGQIPVGWPFRPNNVGATFQKLDIHGLISSLNFKNCNREIKTIHAQDSVAGVLVLVTGILTEKDGEGKLFSQSFLLEQEGTDVFILNDVSWYHKESGPDERKETPDLPSLKDSPHLFVDVYYEHLHGEPEKLSPFYKATSVLSCQDSNGVMTTANTIEGIHGLISSLNFKNCNREIKTIHAQDSVAGVLVLVTGILLIEEEGERWLFSQSFLLEQQESEVFILNDISCYCKECGPDERKETLAAVADRKPCPTQALGSERMTENRLAVDSASEASKLSSEASTSTASRSASVAGHEAVYLNDASEPSTFGNKQHENIRFSGSRRTRGWGRGRGWAWGKQRQS